MKGTDSVPICIGRENAIHQVRLYLVEEERLKGILHISRAGRGDDIRVRWMCGLEGTSEELSGDEGE